MCHCVCILMYAFVLTAPAFCLCCVLCNEGMKLIVLLRATMKFSAFSVRVVCILLRILCDIVLISGMLSPQGE